MKVVYVVRNLDRYSGAATQANNLAKEIDSECCSVCLVNISDSAQTGLVIENGIRVHTLNRSKNHAMKFLRIIKSSEVVHFHGMFLKHILLAKMMRKKIVLKTTLAGEDDFLSIRNSKFGWFKLFVLKCGVNINNALAENIREINSRYISTTKIVKIPNFVSPNPAAPSKKNFDFLFVGAIIKRKRPDLSIQYFLKNYIDIPNTRLFLVGPYDIEEQAGDLKYATKLKEYELKHPGRIIFLGKQKQDKVIDMYSQSLALLFFSEHEGMPNSVLEAMANNCLPVIGEIGGVSHEIVDCGTTGYILKESESERVPLQDILRLVDNRAPLQSAIEKYSFTKGAIIYKKLYKRLVKDGI